MNLRELDKKAIAKRVQTARNSANLSQEEFAELQGIAVNTVSKIECGLRGLSLERLSAICQITGVSADYILFGKNANDSRLIPGVAEALSSLSPEIQEYWKETIMKANFIL